MSTILNNQIQQVSETRLSSLAMTSALSHWLTAKPFVLSLYKYDTTRMVGRLINSTAIYISLLISLKTTPPAYIIKYSSLTTPLNIFPISPHSLHRIIPPTYTFTAYILLILYIYLQNPHLTNPLHIPTHPKSH